MKILFCSHQELHPRLGWSRVVMPLADALRPLGWTCELVGPAEIGVPPDAPDVDGQDFVRTLHGYLQRRAGEFDVVDYDHQFLPFPRSDFASRTRFVARSVLLVHYVRLLQPPELLRLHQRVKGWLTASAYRVGRRQQAWIRDARTTIANADLINLCNEDERALLLEEGVPREKTVVIPFGLQPEEFAALEGVNTGRQDPMRVCFVGTFDGRKGGVDLPRIFARVARRFPACQFRLLGTAGLHQTRERVLSFFPAWLRDRLEIIPRFQRTDLPKWLDGCAVGVFPSYFEGFPFGVLEMLAAGLPVVGYRSPGLPETLTDDLLVPPGDVDATADRLIALLADEPARARKAAWARGRARAFTWEAVARETDEVYQRLCGQMVRV